MNKFRKRHAYGIAIALVIILISPIFIILSIPILLIVMLDFSLTKPLVNKQEEIEEVPVEEECNIDKLRAVIEQIEIIKEKEIDYRKNVDLRQFKGRSNVTKEELAKYLWVHYIWEGRKEKEIICDEVSKVCNINESDIEWVFNEHYKHKGNDGSVGGGYWIRNEEAKREIEYENKKVREKDKEWNRFLKQNPDIEKSYKDKIKNNLESRKTYEEHLYIFYYDEWLKMKGYI